MVQLIYSVLNILIEYLQYHEYVKIIWDFRSPFLQVFYLNCIKYYDNETDMAFLLTLASVITL